MILSITKIELNSYSKLIPFFNLNGQIIKELKQSNCLKFKMTGNWNLKIWYTMTLWENDNQINDFLSQGFSFRSDEAIAILFFRNLFHSNSGRRFDELERSKKTSS